MRVLADEKRLKDDIVRFVEECGCPEGRRRELSQRLWWLFASREDGFDRRAAEKLAAALRDR